VTIERGVDWGAPGRLADSGIEVRSDAELGRLVDGARRRGEPLPEVGLLAGDLCATLGGRGEAARLSDGTGQRLPIDIVRARLDGVDHWFVCHLVARRARWHGRFVIAMNADRLGEWLLAPAGHPNDGRVDVTDGSLGPRDRLRARARARTGAHLPHPSLLSRRVQRWAARLDRPTPVRLDGRRVGRATEVELEVEPDALVVVV